MPNASSLAIGGAMPVATTFTLPKSGIPTTIVMHGGKTVMFGRVGRAS